MIVVGDEVHARQLQRTQLTTSDFWDKDIAALNLSDSEKDGLQVFRNYQRAFQAHAERAFAKEIDAEPFDTAPLERVLALIANEDVRFLPVITCAYVDDLLKTMFKAELPDDVPSGASALCGPYGPLSTLFNRLQLAFVFDMLSPELVQDLDQIRKVRNDLSHSWDITTFQDFFTKGTITDLFPIDTLFAKQEMLQSFPHGPRAVESVPGTATLADNETHVRQRTTLARSGRDYTPKAPCLARTSRSGYPRYPASRWRHRGK